MRRISIGLLAWTLVLWALLPPAALPGQPGRAPARTILDDESRLHVVVSLAVRYRPLDEILASLQRETGVSLSARGEVADVRASLFFDERPAAEVLGRLARHLGLRWYRKGKGFELAVDPANDVARRGAADLEGQLAAIEQRMKELPALAVRSTEQLEARQREIDQQLDGGELSAPDLARLQEEKAAIDDLLRAAGPTCALLYQRLKPAQRQQLRATGDLYLTTTGGTLRADDARQLFEPNAALYRQAAPLETVTSPPVEDPTAVYLRIRLTTERVRGNATGRRGDRRLVLAFEQAFKSPMVIRTGFWKPLIQAAPAEAATRTDDPALLRRVDLPLSLLKQLGGARPFTTGPARFAKTELLLPLGGLAEVLHRATGLQVLADGFIRARVDATKIATPEGHPRPLVEVLDALAAALDYTWRRDGDTLLLRSRTDYFDLPAEVPERILRPWVQKLTRRGQPRLEELEDLEPVAALAAALTDEQCRGLDEFWEWYVEGSGLEKRGLGSYIDENRTDLRLWASLTPAHRQALREGIPLPVGRMDAKE